MCAIAILFESLSFTESKVCCKLNFIFSAKNENMYSSHNKIRLIFCSEYRYSTLGIPFFPTYRQTFTLKVYKITEQLLPKELKLHIKIYSCKIIILKIKVN